MTLIEEECLASTGLSQGELRDMTNFITQEMPSLLNIFVARTLPSLAPPLHHCYDCEQPLVSYNSCQVKCYTTNGVSTGRKFTLRCLRCNLYYNYAQFGNKRLNGFRFYPMQQSFVEASDTVYIHRELLEFQCCLA